MGSRRTRQACVTCRDRKVKCDRAQPYCSRCVRLNERCSYDTFPAGTNLSRQVQDLQKRLERAEAQLGTRGQDATPSGADTGLPLLMPLPRDSTNSNTLPSGPGTTIIQQEVAYLGGGTTFRNANLGFDQLLELDSVEKLCWDTPNDALLQSVAHIDPSLLANNWSSGPLLDMPQTIPWAGSTMKSGQDRPLPGSHPTHPVASLERVLPELYRYFFKYVYNSMPVISETRFLAELSANPPSKSIYALKYSVALLSAAMSSQYQHLRHDLYNLVRRQIEDCEMDPDTTVFSNLNVFQTLLFMVRYEIMSSNITRAWMTLGRAIRLSSVLRLHMMDSSGGPDDAVPGLHVSLPATDDECLLEERRRSFWLLFVWETYIKTRTAMESQLGPVSSFYVKLPSLGRLGPEFSAVDMPFLANANRLTTGVSPFCACLLMVDLAMKCLNKADDSSEHRSSLERCFRERMFVMQEPFEGDASSWDPIALTTNLNMGAISIILHEKTHKSREAPEMGMERISTRQDTAKHIVDILKACWGTRMMEGNPFTLQATFLAWPLATAINTLVEALQLSVGTDFLGDLVELFVILDELEQDEGYWHTFTQDARQRLSGINGGV
uniref:Putative Zn2Cys6 DNA-binding transcription factor n=1 Tax=Fusarium scirpi TaxID=2211609 RepID=A0A1Y0B9N3_9HYPO|nr:putative Zn2Cys6 DNA-binding transcription factor [Fusarium scirpi]